MQKPRKPANEILRQQKLDALKLLGTPAGAIMDDVVRVAAQACGTPLAMLNLIDHDRLWAKARIGDIEDECAREVSFCAHVVESGSLLVIPDAAADPRFADNPLVTGKPGLRFYAGAPLAFGTGEVIGTLSVLDHHPRTLSTGAREALCALARGVIAHLELRAIVMDTSERERRAARHAMDAWTELRTPIGVLGAALDGIRDQSWPIADRASLEVARRAGADLRGRFVDAAPGNADARVLAGLDVLVVEDATIHQKVIRALLEPHGARIDVAGTGEEGLDKFRAKAYGLVLMDRHLPGIDGLDAIRQMRAGERAGRTPILGASATNDAGAHAEFLAAGADETIAKPIRLEEFWAKFFALPNLRRAAG